jgi:sugar lactone lactonase YvrE
MGETAEPRLLLTGLAIGESPRWHEGRLWFCNWGTQEIVAADLESNSEVMAHVPTTLPFSIDWLPDGRMIVVSGPEALLLRREPDGALVTHADLSGLADAFNEIVVDSRGNAYVNGDIVALVRPDGSARQVADDVAFGNGMAITEDGSTLIVAESWARRLSAFDIAADGGLSNRRVWADLGESPPDGICVDAEGAVWFADVPNKRCVRVREGGEVLQTIGLDRGGFACMLGGPDGRCSCSRPSGPAWRTWTPRRAPVGSSWRRRPRHTPVGRRRDGRGIQAEEEGRSMLSDTRNR